MGQEINGEVMGEQFKGYVFRITGGNDKQGFTMKQGILVQGRSRILFKKRKCFGVTMCSFFSMRLPIYLIIILTGYNYYVQVALPSDPVALVSARESQSEAASPDPILPSSLSVLLLRVRMRSKGRRKTMPIVSERRGETTSSSSTPSTRRTT